MQIFRLSSWAGVVHRKAEVKCLMRSGSEELGGVEWIMGLGGFGFGEEGAQV